MHMCDLFIQRHLQRGDYVRQIQNLTKNYCLYATDLTNLLKILFTYVKI